MQMVWKNKNSKKRPHSSRSLGLPFEPTSPEREEAEKNGNNRGIDAETTRSGRRFDAAASSADVHDNGDGKAEQIAQRLQEEGNSMAEEGKYVEALGKWEAAIVLVPTRAVLHEQKSQVLLELGRSWMAVQAATRATELQPSWPEAWVTLARSQLNYGEPALAVTSSQTALRLKPGHKDAQTVFETAQSLAIKQRHISYVGVEAASRLAIGGIQSISSGNMRRAIVVDEEHTTLNSSSAQLMNNPCVKDHASAPGDASCGTDPSADGGTEKVIEIDASETSSQVLGTVDNQVEAARETPGCVNPNGEDSDHETASGERSPSNTEL